VLSDLRVLDTEAGTWSRHVDKSGCEPLGRFRHAMRWAGRLGSSTELLLIIGGMVDNKTAAAPGILICTTKRGQTGPDSLDFEYRPVKLVGNVTPAAHIGHTVISDAEGVSYYFGGSSHNGHKIHQDLFKLKVADVPASGPVTVDCQRLVTTGEAPGARFGHGACLATLNGRKTLVVQGGGSDQEHILDQDMYFLSLDTLIWRRLAFPQNPHFMPVKHDLLVLPQRRQWAKDATLIAIAGGVACFSFGAHYNPLITEMKVNE